MNENALKEEYIININNLLNQADIPLLDLVYKILAKRIIKTSSKDYPTSA